MTQTVPRHFIDLSDIDRASLQGILDCSRAMKTARAGQPQGATDPDRPLAGRLLAMLFERPSTRTRVSFDVAMRQLGGETLLLSAQDLQLKRGETMADTARVLSRYVDAIMIRCAAHASLLELKDYASVPVVNGLTDWSHPCQIMADLLTFEEHKGPIKGRTIAWLGDGNNVARSWVHAAASFDFTLRVACPPELALAEETRAWAVAEGARVEFTADADRAVAGADALVTDTWISMGDKESERRHNLLAPYAVDQRLMSLAAEGAIFMHCLPAHRGEEVSAEVIDGPRSVVWDEAENRLHAQKGVLAWCLAGA